MSGDYDLVGSPSEWWLAHNGGFGHLVLVTHGIELIVLHVVRAVKRLLYSLLY